MESINFLRVSYSELDGWAERVFIVIRGRENVFCRLTGQFKSIGNVKSVLMVLPQFVTVQPYESNGAQFNQVLRLQPHVAEIWASSLTVRLSSCTIRHSGHFSS